MSSFGQWPGPPGRLLLAFVALSFLTYWPALDNGYISDDFIGLERADRLLQEPLHLWRIPPENFRTTTYLTFGLVTAATGYRPWLFYLLKILLHALVALLLCRLVWRATRDRVAGLTSGLLFACLQNPHEAVMWLTGTHELLLTLFLLGAVLLWLEGRWRWSLVLYCLALLSKESAPVLLLLLPVAGWWARERVLLRREYLYFLVPSLVFGLLFASGMTTNSLLAHRFYAFGPGALLVWLRSLHALAFPWLYLVLAMAWLSGRWPSWATLRGPFVWTSLALLPYLFLTYQDHVPSRHEYLPSLGLAAALALVVSGLRRTDLRLGFLGLFMVANAGYVWWVKDAQFEERAAPTRQLLSRLERSPPQAVRVEDFPLNPWIARTAIRVLPGWGAERLQLDSPPATCPECLTLRWDNGMRDYVEVPAGGRTSPSPRGEMRE